ncbi:MAG: NAD(+)/NADH kinase [Oscillospiraceae bacterium]|nr:NAD(+)/NADH kinase [Oscillospiraceae bacterium]
MKIVIFPNLKKKDAFSCTVEVCRRLDRTDTRIFMDQKYAGIFSELKNISYGDFRTLAEGADFAIAIGGDGTILKCAAAMMGTGTKLLGINTGRLGFMASVEKDRLDALEQLYTGEYRVSDRMILAAEYETEEGKKVFRAMNDIVVSSRYSKIMEFDVYAGENLIGSYLADGVVLSTPTGSTAYALSAGGPIIEPELECLEMNLICPHSLFVRPMIFNAGSVISVVHHSSEDVEVGFSVDGNEPVKIKRESRLIIRKSAEKIKLIDIRGGTFYDSLNKKLMRSLKGN